jgi:hypothetical protein
VQLVLSQRRKVKRMHLSKTISVSSRPILFSTVASRHVSQVVQRRPRLLRHCLRIGDIAIASRKQKYLVNRVAHTRQAVAVPRRKPKVLDCIWQLTHGTRNRQAGNSAFSFMLLQVKCFATRAIYAGTRCDAKGETAIAVIFADVNGRKYFYFFQVA